MQDDTVNEVLIAEGNKTQTTQNTIQRCLHEHQAMLETTHEGVLIIDLNSKIVRVNSAYSQLTKFEESELFGRNPTMFIVGRADKLYYEKIWKNIQSSDFWQGEVWVQHKTGELSPQMLTIKPVFNQQRETLSYLAVFADIRQLDKNQEQIELLAHHDHLTQLPNRSLIEIRLKQEIERAARQNYHGCVLFIDLDRFKPINEGLGHIAGDELLHAVAQRLNGRLRKGDALGRLGGDEFMLLIFPSRDIQDTAVIARDFIATLDAPFALSGLNEIFISASIGISLFPQDGNTATELMKNADAAMTLAKNNGGNQFSFYSKEINTKARSQLELESDLRRALQQQELSLHYQPKVNLHTGQICGVEALARWKKPNGEMVSPADFIPIAEKSNLILTLGNWLIDHSCWQMRQWIDMGFADIHVAINISARQFRSGDLDQLLQQALNKYQINPSHLELELTESMLMQEPELAVATMRRLKDIGLKISLDDFGTGYSSLAYLTRFPIDTLKIDQSFVKNLTTDPTAGEIAMAIIGLAHRMNLCVIAEGVETESHLTYLRNNNCDEIQGYYFSKPLPATQLEELLQSKKHLPATSNTQNKLPSLLLFCSSHTQANSLLHILNNVNYDILLADNEENALEHLALHSCQLVLAIEPNQSQAACNLMSKVKELHPHTIRLMIAEERPDLLKLNTLINNQTLHKLLVGRIEEKMLAKHVQDAFLFHQTLFPRLE